MELTHQEPLRDVEPDAIVLPLPFVVNILCKASPTPKGFDSKAQGRERSERTLGTSQKQPRTPKGFHSPLSIPNVTFVDRDTVLLTKPPEFILERFRLVMFYLIGNMHVDLHE
jgi:hypothetical protein